MPKLKFSLFPTTAAFLTSSYADSQQQPPDLCMIQSFMSNVMTNIKMNNSEKKWPRARITEFN